ncbi:MAG TPA: tetratricopeptide repeat protein, partial [Pyrinomonadaceae bacterium]|nr:tetratricopeptide repeat protein [Pyrinomonadaceae bacterium]
LGLESPPPGIHRGLGMLYEKLGRQNDAMSEYQKYIELAPSAIDRERIQRRIQMLTKGEK